ncbi:hypothetical protein FRX31_011813 [Thalictrum thalictroides]|uniref:Uncharacterized protein n=1 Tax=Thalictrum thalictroides TaxID=46969 RepID=A0A7J6WPT4_THATH|nr:hypothetical protein FRX31_011813 [Thalictrum thalictroides]
MRELSGHYYMRMSGPRGKGRPPIQRKRGIDEGPIRYGGKKQHRCSSCKGYGHNKTSCPGFDADHVNYMSISHGVAKKGAAEKCARPRTIPRKIDYGVPTENITADPIFSDFIAQFEPMVATRGKGKKKTYKGKGKKRANVSQTSDASQPFDLSLYGYGTTSAQHNFQVRNQTPMHNTFDTFDPTFYGYVPKPPTPSQTFQQSQPYSSQFNSPSTSTMPQVPPVRPQAQAVILPQQQTAWRPPPYLHTQAEDAAEKTSGASETDNDKVVSDPDNMENNGTK